jgi:hypothetical protein
VALQMESGAQVRVRWSVERDQKSQSQRSLSSPTFLSLSFGRKARRKSLERANLGAFAFWALASCAESKSGPVLRKKDGTRDEFLFVQRARGRCALESAEI